MAITVTIAKTLSDADFATVDMLVRELQETDQNFAGRAIFVERGSFTAVYDPADAMREALLMLMVRAVLNDV